VERRGGKQPVKPYQLDGLRREGGGEKKKKKEGEQSLQKAATGKKEGPDLLQC